MALGKPILGIVSLDAMVEAAKDRGRLLVPAIDAKWDQIYGAVYEAGVRTSEILAEKPEVFAARVPAAAFVFGDALEKYAELFGGRGLALGPREIWIPKPAAIGRLAAREWTAGRRHDVATLVPLYLRPTEAELKFGKKS